MKLKTIDELLKLFRLRQAYVNRNESYPVRTGQVAFCDQMITETARIAREHIIKHAIREAGRA